MGAAKTATKGKNPRKKLVKIPKGAKVVHHTYDEMLKILRNDLKTIEGWSKKSKASK